MPWEAVKSRTLGARSSPRWSKVIGPAVAEARRLKRTAVVAVVKRIFALVMLKLSCFFSESEYSSAGGMLERQSSESCRLLVEEEMIVVMMMMGMYAHRRPYLCALRAHSCSVASHLFNLSLTSILLKP